MAILEPDQLHVDSNTHIVPLGPGAVLAPLRRMRAMIERVMRDRGTQSNDSHSKRENEFIDTSKTEDCKDSIVMSSALDPVSRRCRIDST